MLVTCLERCGTGKNVPFVSNTKTAKMAERERKKERERQGCA
jgi:hypothetical protein